MADRLPEATIRTAVPVPLSLRRRLRDDGAGLHLRRARRRARARRPRARRPVRPDPTRPGRRVPSAHPRPQRVPHRGRLREPAVRLRPAAARGRPTALRDRGLPALPAAGGTRHRPLRQARRLRPAGLGARHLPGQRGPRLRGGRARLRRRGPDALALGVPRVALLTNNPDKADQLGRLGITVTSLVATGVHLSPANAHYLATKATHGSHTLDLPPTDGLDPTRVRGRLTTRDEGEPHVHHRALHVDVPRRLHRRTERRARQRPRRRRGAAPRLGRRG